jgi:hypothetical protein
MQQLQRSLEPVHGSCMMLGMPAHKLHEHLQGRLQWLMSQGCNLGL